METTLTMDEFISKYGLTITARQVEPAAEQEKDWGAGSSHWKITLIKKLGRRMTVPFREGSAHTQPPTAAEVLDCLVSDASSLEYADSYEEWASNLGFDPDSRKDEKIYKQCKAQSAKLCDLLGYEAYNALLYSVEKL